VSVVRGIGLGLDEKAIEAVRQYKFKPAMENGKPVVVEMHVEVNFQILLGRAPRRMLMVALDLKAINLAFEGDGGAAQGFYTCGSRPPFRLDSRGIASGWSPATRWIGLPLRLAGTRQSRSE